MFASNSDICFAPISLLMPDNFYLKLAAIIMQYDVWFLSLLDTLGNFNTVTSVIFLSTYKFCGSHRNIVDSVLVDYT